jgi:hypothetical protein
MGKNLLAFRGLLFLDTTVGQMVPAQLLIFSLVTLSGRSAKVLRPKGGIYYD